MKQNHIGENIRIYRERANLTQQQLADRVGISWEMISRYERSESSPHNNLGNLSDALDISKSELLEKHIPERYKNTPYKIPLFIQFPQSNRFTPNQTNYYYVCPEWILKRDSDCIAIDNSLIDSHCDNLSKNGVVYISTQIKLQKDDLVLIKDRSSLKTEKYSNSNMNILGKVIAQEVRY